MINDREEALAAHKLARTRIANRKQSKFVPFEKDQKVHIARHEEFEDESSQKDYPET
jgi:hypothetical protein